jgi:hypothetical protein
MAQYTGVLPLVKGGASHERSTNYSLDRSINTSATLNLSSTAPKAIYLHQELSFHQHTNTVVVSLIEVQFGYTA